MSNKTLIGINVGLIIAVIILFVLHFMGRHSIPEEVESDVVDIVQVEDTVESYLPEINTSEKTLPDFKRGLRIAFVNSDSVNNQYKYYEDVKEKLTAETQRAQASFQGKANAFQKKYNDFMKEINSNMITSQAEMDRRSGELGAEEQSLARKEQELSMKLQNSQIEAQTIVTKETSEYLNKIGSELGYDYVISYSEAVPVVLYANKELDITEYVINKLNEAYSAKLNEANAAKTE